MECLLENISTCHNDPSKSTTIKINEQTPSGYSLLPYCSFDNKKIGLVIIEVKTV